MHIHLGMEARVGIVKLGSVLTVNYPKFIGILR